MVLLRIKTASERQGDSNRYDYYNTEKDAKHNKENSKYGQCNFPTLQMKGCTVWSVRCEVSGVRVHVGVCGVSACV